MFKNNGEDKKDFTCVLYFRRSTIYKETLFCTQMTYSYNWATKFGAVDLNIFYDLLFFYLTLYVRET